jgi:solute carrier family 25 carnitine/acylcarnitine transporter 20/29
MSRRLVEVGKDLTAGTMAGIAQLLVGHPFDTVKVKLQSQMAEMSNQAPQYTGAFDAVRKIMASEGPKGLYRGLSAPLAAVALFNAVLFTARGQMEALLLHNRKPYATLSVPQQMVAGAGAGVAVSFVACPTELVKCRLQAQSTSESATGPSSVEENKAISENDQTTLQGIATPTVVNSNPNPPSNEQGDIGLSPLVINHDAPEVENNAGDLEAAAVLRHPELQPAAPAHKYDGSLDVAKQIYCREGGVFGFFKGLSPTFLREVFGNAAYFGSYQGTKQLLSRGGTGENLSTGSLLVAGGVAGAMFWLLVYPADVIKSTIQVDDYRNPKYTSTFDAFRKVFKSQGMQGLYCGFGPAMARSVLANAVCFFVYELVRKAFK